MIWWYRLQYRGMTAICLVVNDNACKVDERKA